MATIKEIEAKTKRYADAREELSTAVRKLRARIEALHREHLPDIKRCVARSKDAESALRADVEASPELFVRPRSLVSQGQANCQIFRPLFRIGDVGHRVLAPK